jgi:3-dehydroquinate synthase
MKTRTIDVKLGERSYSIMVGENNLAELGAALAAANFGRRLGIVTDPKIAALYLEPVEHSLRGAGFDCDAIFLPAGEEHKNLAALAAIYDRLIDARFERGSALVALGGGVIGDVTGFAAATYLRGIPYVQVPTTLLAQVDSSVGGKTAVNHREGKNLIGAFYQPRLVWIDVAVLRSLPQRELVAGLAEVIKYGIIADAALFSRLEEKADDILKGDAGMLAEIVAASCGIKASVVEKDERESDLRAILNFGHTVGHALEAVTRYERFLHGEAVAIGMVQAARISVAEGACDRSSFERIRALIARAGLPVELPGDVHLPELIKHMEIDKKSAAGKIKFVLCEGIGRTRFHALAPGEIAARLAAGAASQ